MPIIYVLQPFTASLFCRRWLNQFDTFSDDSTVQLHHEPIEIKSHLTLLEKHAVDHETHFLNMQIQMHQEREYNLELTNIVQDLSSRMNTTIF